MHTALNIMIYGDIMGYIDKFDDIEISCDNCENSEQCENVDIFSTDDILYMDGKCGSIDGEVIRFKPIVRTED